MNIRKQIRIEQAQERQRAYDALTLDEKIARAEYRGGTRELARLRKLRAAQQEAA